MVQADSQGRSVPISMRDLADEPQLLERGLKVLDVALKLSPLHVVDLLLKDSSSRPVIVLGEGSDGPQALLGRALGVLAEVRRVRPLLDRLFRQDGVSFGADPRVILVARRFADSLLGAGELLRSWGVELVEAHDAPGDGGVTVVRAGGAATTSAPPASDSKPPPADERVARPLAPPSPLVPPVAPVVIESKGVNGNGTNGHAPRTPTVVDEAKKKILRISDDIEEEVDGAIVRFRLHDELIAVLEPAPDGCSMMVGDAPERRRMLVEHSDLNAAVDDVVRRYFTLARQFAARPPTAKRAGAGSK